MPFDAAPQRAGGAGAGGITEEEYERGRQVLDALVADPEVLAILLEKLADRMRSPPPPRPPPKPQHVRVATLEVAPANPCVSYDTDGNMMGINGYDIYDSDNEDLPVISTVSFIYSHYVVRDGTHFVCSCAGLYRVGSSGTLVIVAGSEDEKNTGIKDGVGTEARFNGPGAMAEGPDGCLIISDTNNNCLRKVDVASGKVVTLVGGRGGKEAGYADGAGTDALFMLPVGLDVDRDGTIYVADSNNHAIRKVTPDLVVSTLSGVPEESHKKPYFADGSAREARYSVPRGVALCSDRTLVVSDANNQCVRRVRLEDGHVTTIAGAPEQAGCSAPCVRALRPLC